MFARTFEVTKARADTVLGARSTVSYSPRGSAGKRFSIETSDQSAFGLTRSVRRVIRRVVEDGQEQQTVVRSRTTISAGPFVFRLPSRTKK